LNEAFEKEGSSTGAGMGANDAAPGGMEGEHSASALSPPQPGFDDFPELTEDELAGIYATMDALSKPRSSAAPNSNGIRLNETFENEGSSTGAGMGANDAALGGMDTVPSPGAASHRLALGATQWLEDDHIATDYALLGEALHRASPAVAARTRLVAPAVAHFLRMARNPAEAAAAFDDIVEGGTANFVFLPVNNAAVGAGGTHWSLLFVDLRGRRPIAYHYDSAAGQNSAIAQGLAARLDARFERVRMAQQDNGYDCGVFVVDATRALAARLAEGERPGSQPLHLDALVADRQALLDRLTAASNARAELASSSRSRERSYRGR
ncbi:Ulp1 family isopeptidase, partial